MNKKTEIKRIDAGVVAYILVAALFFIFPIPNRILDVMLGLNIAIAFIILLKTLFVSEVLDMSYFPKLLNLIAIFKIALNVSSTRLILSTGSPGSLIATFGQLAGGNDIVICAIVFVALVLIQFMVIIRGYKLVPEVTARFILDTMPGKQLAINAALYTGDINDEEAKNRRANLQEKSNFLGKMDGAMKFIKGDAIACLIITVINLIGGVIIGVTRDGMVIGDALVYYGTLTTGDGLSFLIPSLLIFLSICILIDKGKE